jgi:hypothetical protein
MLQVGGEVSVFSYAEHGGLLAEQGRQGQPVIFDRFDGSPIVVFSRYPIGSADIRNRQATELESIAARVRAVF